MITWTKGFIRIGEVFFDEIPQIADVDVIRYNQRSVSPATVRFRDFFSIVVDLTRPGDVLFSGLKKDTRYEIRRARERDSFTYVGWGCPDTKTTEDFCTFYDRFAASKGLPPSNRSRLASASRGGSLTLSTVLDPHGNNLVWHAYYRLPDRVRLLYSASLYRSADTQAERQRIGRGNRFHHWEDITSFKSVGITDYDFGGWYEGRSDPERLRINAFKEEFGGSIVKQYTWEDGITQRGKFALLLRDLNQSI
jgi:hypothetical protein